MSTIARDNFADLGGISGTTAQLTASYANAGNLLLVFIDPGTAPTSVTFNGNAMTLLLSSTSGKKLYYMFSPGVVTANIVINFAGNEFAEAAAISYKGVDITGFDASSVTQDATSEATYTSTVSTNVDACWGVGCSSTTDSSCSGMSGSFTQRVLCSTFANAQLGDTNGLVHPAGSLTFTTTLGAAGHDSHLFVSIRPEPPREFLQGGASFVFPAIRRGSGGSPT